MAKRPPFDPYLIALATVLQANAQGVLSYTVPAGQRLHVKEWRWTSTGIFNLIDIVDSESTHFGSMSAQNPLLSTYLQSPLNNNYGIKDVPAEMTIEPQQTIQFIVIDTSAAGNTIRAALNCSIEYVQ